jgi:3-methylcrotonyl-CoA carboxylase alpha subunit
MFNKILIANRGEIACRVIKTARRLGIRTVAVFSDADMAAMHVRLADEAVHIGASAAQESYLVGERIIQAALRSGAQAIHPGYGFLSENATFCQACEQAGLVFIGPPASAIQAMGSKSQAKLRMEQAGVPVVPGYHGQDQTPALLHEHADHIAYPVLIKACAGGGGKGMRLVERTDDFLAALASCQREALSSFGDDRVLLEKYIIKPRHIEIQVFADTLGHAVYLFERDCSVQRRHQKVLEEAPAPNWSPSKRQAMGLAAVEAAKAVGYVGAGTVEFIVSPDHSFYFMEMNTRLQVEHPVTEMITGLDLVEWQLRVAAGGPLPLLQDQIVLNGHAMEARVYAEDPDKGFLPSVGRLLHVHPPAEHAAVRVDTGVQTGDEITPYYDPMIAKLIVWGQDREQARLRMLQALADYEVLGVHCNLSFLHRLVSSPSFSTADLDTGLIERERSNLFPTHWPVPIEVLVLTCCARLASEQQPQAEHLWCTGESWRLNQSPQRLLHFECAGAPCTVAVQASSSGYDLTINEQSHSVKALSHEGYDFNLMLNQGHIKGRALVMGQQVHVFWAGHAWVLDPQNPCLSTGLGLIEESSLHAPMPGKVIAVHVSPGQWVEKSKPLLTLEAMKMEHTIFAPSVGLVKHLRVQLGDWVADGAELLEFEPNSP